MLKSKLKKRSHLIRGRPIKKKPRPHEEGRRGNHYVIEDKDEYDVEYESFFEFQSDLDELEASNEQERKAAIYNTKTTETIETPAKESVPIVMEEEEEKTYNPIVMEDYEEVPIIPEFKRCLFVKTNGIQCKRQAPKKSDYCSAHRKK